MNVKQITIRIAAICIITASPIFASGAVTLVPSQPTHYLYMPMAVVNPPHHLVLGLREISYVLPGNLQLQLSLVDNIGKTVLAAKYPLAGNIAVGGGLAGRFIDMSSHGSGNDRLGLFCAIGLADRGDFSMALTPHSQIGNHVSVGADFGLMKEIDPWWGVLWEAGLSADLTGKALYLYTTGAIRIHPPSVKILSIDFGVGTNEFRARRRTDINPEIFFDIMIAFIAG